VILQIDSLTWCDTQGLDHGVRSFGSCVVTNVAVARLLRAQE
jgi:hypothetical protein